jgi:hypothetical protein
MLTRIMKCVSLMALVAALFFWRPGGGYAIVLQFVICGSAVLVAFEAFRSGKQLWTIAFAGLAVLFNPVVAVSFSRGVFPWISVLCFAMFLASLRFLRTAPALSIASVTYTGPRDQAL